MNNGEQTAPIDPIPSNKVDLFSLPAEQNILIWLGHSSYFLQIEGKKILIDPVLSDFASPFSFMVNAYPGSNPYRIEDIPDIDYLLISHDHWDHLDYPTVLGLKNRIKQVIVGLGNGAHFAYWGFNQASIIEKDWYDQLPLTANLTLHLVPARG